jgi:tetratricopeptide (TPR) repeat protein
VALALGVALGAGERERLRERPTKNLAAYDAYLKGREITGGPMGTDPLELRRAVEYYERAVALDSSFTLAWAELSLTHSDLYWSAPNSAAAAEARRAAERALALAPKQPEGYQALGYDYAMVRYDPANAVEQYDRGLELAPKDARLLAAVAWAKMGLRRFDEALAQEREAQVLDPRSAEILIRVTKTLLYLHRYDEALPAADHTLALAPRNLAAILTKVLLRLGEGDLAGARAVLHAGPREVDPAALVADVANSNDLYWVLDDAQQRLLLRLSPEPFGDDRDVWALCLAETYALRGDTTNARAYADSARLAWEARLRDVPQDPVIHVYLGVTLAYLGRRSEALREGERGVALLPISRNAWEGPFIEHQLVRIYLLLGEYDKALDRLESLLRIPYWLSPGWLRIDPTFDPLRGNPRFERLVKGS